MKIKIPGIFLLSVNAIKLQADPGERRCVTREKGARTGLVKYKQLSFVEEGPARLGDQLPQDLVK